MMLLTAMLPGAPGAAPILRTPDIHGNQVAFACEGDIWIGDLRSGRATRLTRHAGNEERPKFSPDGSQIVFTGSYDGVRELYVMPSTGGAPKRLTWTYDYATPMDWTADGSSVLYTSRGTLRSYRLYQVPAAGGPSERVKIEFMSHASHGPSGNKITFTRFLRSFDSWFHYQGGMQNEVWVGDTKKGEFKRITETPGTSEYPTWAASNIYFANEQHAKFRLMATKPSGGGSKTVVGPYDIEIRNLGTDGKNLIYEKGVDLEVYNPASGKTSPVKFNLTSDLMHTRSYRVDPMKHVSSGSLSPTGKRVYVETRGQIIDVPAGEGETRLWKAQDGVRLQLPQMSPDGKSMAYVSDEDGEHQIYVSGADGSGAKKLTNGSKRQIKSMSWSPDSKWIAYNDSNMSLHLVNVANKASKKVNQAINDWGGTIFDWSPDSKWMALQETNGITAMSRLALYEIATGKKHRLGNGLTDDTDPSFSPDGKHLAFASRRNFGVAWDSVLNQMNTKDVMSPCVYLLQKDVPNPLMLKDQAEPEAKKEAKKPAEAAKKPEFKIDLDGINERLVVLPGMQGNINQVLHTGTRVIVGVSGEIKFFDLKTKKAGSLTKPGGSFSTSPDRKKLLLSGRVVDAAGTSVAPTAGALKAGGLTLKVDPKAEWEQMYWDAWRLLRDYFYVENMHGNDWPAIGEKYAKFLPRIRSRNELDLLIKWMQAELGSSHQYLRAGDEQNIAPTARPAYLGIVVKPHDSGLLQISEIYKGDGIVPGTMSPLAVAGINAKVGDFLLSVAGQKLTSKDNYLEHIAGRAGQTISVELNSKPSREGSKKHLVKPVGSERIMKRLDWVEKNRLYVEKASNGRVGYIYLAAMSTPDMADFIKQFYPQRDKQALVIDTRFNGGGNTQSVMNRILQTPLSGYFNMRASRYPWSRQGDHFLGPMACIQNEFNVSCGEEFPHRFRDLGLGKIIGRRTYGGEVGSSPGWPLADGGVVSVPNYGMFTPDGKWAIEGPGVEPDIDVESDPNAYFKGVDPQLDKTIEHLLAEVAKNPIKRPVIPPDRVMTGGGS